MKKIFAVAAQLVLFLFLDAVGGLVYQPFRVTTILSRDLATQRTFQWDGVIFMVIAYLLLVTIAALRKRLAGSVRGATLALALAAIGGYLLRFGFKTHEF